MTPTYKPEGRPTFHRDGTVSRFNILTQTWERTHWLSDEEFATLNEGERNRIIRHLARHNF